MKTKKIAAVLLTFIMAIGLMAGCGASNTNQSDSNNDSQSTSTNQSGNEEADTNSENTTDTTGKYINRKWKNIGCILFSFRKYKRCC